MVRSNKSPFLTVEEAAKFLRLEPRTLNNWRWSGKGPRYRKHGQCVVYMEKDLVAFSNDPGNACVTR
ncbi:MAG: helix-turn-helix domain-containing protein [Pseudomonadota bacterium]